MGYFTQKTILTPDEEIIFNSIREALISKTTVLHCDVFGKQYILENKENHYRATVVGLSNMIRLTNTVSNGAEKYRQKFIDYVIAAIVEENHSRISKLNVDSQTTMNRIANEMYEKLLESNNFHANIANDNMNINCKQLNN